VSPPPAVAHPEIVTRRVPVRRPAWIERATSADHKSVALLYLGAAATFLVLAVTEFVLMRVQLIVPDNTMIHPEIFARVLSVSGATFAVLFAVPIALGLIGYVVPLQIGARGVAFPRLNQFSAWLYIAGGAALYLSFLYTPPEGGIAAMPPLSSATFSPSHGVDAWIVGVGLATLGFVCFAINLVVTVANMRAPGLAWRRMPLFSWAATVIGYVLLVIGPVMIAALVMLMIDRHFDGVFYDAGEGGAPLLYEHLSYIYLTGIYLIVVLFAAGAICEILPALARKPIFSRRAVAASFVAIAVLGLLAWMQNMYFAPIGEGWGYMAMVFALALAIPIGVLLFTWVSTLKNSAIRLRAPMLYALGAISTMVFGLVGELAYSVIPVGWGLGHTTASQAATLYVLVGGGVLGGFAALHYWLPKITGRIGSDGIPTIALGIMLFGIHLYAIPMFLAGLDGQPVDVYKYFGGTDLSTFNLIASIGAFFLAFGILLELGALAWSYAHGRLAGHDPWGGTTLEWFALSPPPEHNFDAVPDVRSAEPLLDIREAVRRHTESWQTPERADREPRHEPAEVSRGARPAPGSEGERQSVS
jgi:heme/copper-type cytochrome/quinol oxidase subunit 1